MIKAHKQIVINDHCSEWVVIDGNDLGEYLTQGGTLIIKGAAVAIMGPLKVLGLERKAIRRSCRQRSGRKDSTITLEAGAALMMNNIHIWEYNNRYIY